MIGKIIFFALAVSFAYAGPQNIVRPCALNDYKCLGDIFAANSNCSRRLMRPIPSEYTLESEYGVDEFKFETPYFNATNIDRNLIVRNHDKCYVSEFFSDVESDTAVITVDCPGIEIQSDRTVLRHPSAAEDEYYYFSSWASYPLVRLTMNIKHAESMQVCSAFTFGDVTQLPNFTLHPADKPTADLLAMYLPFMDIYERESFLYRAGPLIKLYINSYICNFGCLF